ncbi:MAG: 4a-hydroxytetrahydrobiopterin dehydratase [bacterium]|nr:4a-hydroxytetrahydrobiopterin dehydratase [bacterium]
MGLADKKCVPCEDASTPKLSPEEAEKLNKEIESWSLEEKNEHLQISKEFKFKDFKEALGFVNKIGTIAEEQDHHPNLYIIYNKVKVVLYTHVIAGLHENDFIVAAKIDDLIKH